MSVKYLEFASGGWVTSEVDFMEETDICNSKTDISLINSYNQLTMSDARRSCDHVGGAMPSEINADGTMYCSEQCLVAMYKFIQHHDNIPFQPKCGDLRQDFWVGLSLKGKKNI